MTFAREVCVCQGLCACACMCMNKCVRVRACAWVVFSLVLTRAYKPKLIANGIVPPPIHHMHAVVWKNVHANKDRKWQRKTENQHGRAKQDKRKMRMYWHVLKFRANLISKGKSKIRECNKKTIYRKNTWRTVYHITNLQKKKAKRERNRATSVLTYLT